MVGACRTYEGGETAESDVVWRTDKEKTLLQAKEEVEGWSWHICRQLVCGMLGIKSVKTEMSGARMKSHR